jgi:hypothetical protein
MKKLLLIPIILFSLNLKSQTYTAGTVFAWYYNIEPDSLLNYTVAPYTHEVYPLNMFGDINNDIELIAHGAVSSGGSGAYISVTSLDPNVSIRMERLDSVFVPATSTWYVTNVAKPLIYGQEIDEATAMWNNTTLYLTDHSGSGGGIKDVNDFIGGEKYIGLKYQNGGVVAYGWVRVECITKDSCYVKELSASPSLVGITEIVKGDAAIYPNPVSDHFYLNDINVNTFDISLLRLCDIYGKDVEFRIEKQIDKVMIEVAPDLPNGCYLVDYRSADKPVTIKLIRIAK